MKSNHKYKTGRRVMNWRVGVLTLTILYCAVMGYHSNDDNTYVREHQEYPLAVFITAEVKEPTLEDKIREYFPRNWKTMIAVAYAESHMDMNAVGYNCYYNEDETIVYKSKVLGSHSTSCKKEHRRFAWSRDCGLLQLNTLAKQCPVETVDEHLKRAAELSKVQGLNSWVTYSQGLHKKYLANN